MVRRIDAERELLEATLDRHGDEMPVPASVALSFAADELLDPTTLPSLGVPPSTATEDPLAVIRGARERLTAAATTLPSVSSSAACARAARFLGDAERWMLAGPWVTG